MEIREGSGASLRSFLVPWSDVRRMRFGSRDAELETSGGWATRPLRGMVPDASAIEQRLRGLAAAHGIPVDDGAS